MHRNLSDVSQYKLPFLVCLRLFHWPAAASCWISGNAAYQLFEMWVWTEMLPSVILEACSEVLCKCSVWWVGGLWRPELEVGKRRMKERITARSVVGREGMAREAGQPSMNCMVNHCGDLDPQIRWPCSFVLCGAFPLKKKWPQCGRGVVSSHDVWSLSYRPGQWNLTLSYVPLTISFVCATKERWPFLYHLRPHWVSLLWGPKQVHTTFIPFFSVNTCMHFAYTYIYIYIYIYI